jgi:hypothetical protein
MSQHFHDRAPLVAKVDSRTTLARDALCIGCALSDLNTITQL